GDEVSGFEYLTHGVQRLLEELSQRSPIAYVETEYFGGAGTQAATVYVDGKAILTATGESGPINRALHGLGVAKTTTLDEFEVVGLGKYRDMDDWAGNE